MLRTIEKKEYEIHQNKNDNPEEPTPPLTISLNASKQPFNQHQVPIRSVQVHGFGCYANGKPESERKARIFIELLDEQSTLPSALPSTTSLCQLDKSPSKPRFI